jgi:gamma-glutamyltranspeptidase/glutathione hydrolase
VPGTGMLLNNCMRLFDPRPGLPNSVGPQQRMLSSMTPTLVLKNGRPFLAVGSPGGTRIITAVLQAIVNVIDHGMSLQQAVEAPRIHTGTVGDGLLLEPGFPTETLHGLTAKGHPVQHVARVAGGMHAIRYQDGLIEGSACWRADGVAVGLSGGQALLEPGEGFAY